MLSEYERGYAEGAKDKVAAVEAAYKMGAAAAFGIEREQAVRDCIAAVDRLWIEGLAQSPGVRPSHDTIVTAMRALLGGSQ